MKDSHKAFIDEYLVNGFNATQAYLKAYPNSTEESANSGASRLLSKGGIKEALNKAREEINELALENLRLNIDIKKIVLEKLKKGEPVEDLLRKIIDVTPDDLYFMYSETLKLVKIGRSINPESRLKAIQSDLGVNDLQIIKTLPQEGYREKEFHDRYKSINDRFENKGRKATEWFKLTPELMRDIWKL